MFGGCSNANSRGMGWVRRNRWMDFPTEGGDLVPAENAGMAALRVASSAPRVGRACQMSLSASN
jgi:hypothetical protein